ncbi:MAG: sugar phosphate isomerase/epimerase family protein, partial [Armatimonadota bacterium]
MHLTAITDEISMDFAHALDVMAEYGCKSAELRSLWDTNIADLTPEQLDEAQRILDRKGFQVCCLASPLYKCELGSTTSSGAVGRTHQATARTADEQLDLLKHLAAVAKRFGTPYIRIFSFWKRGDLSPEIETAIAEGISDGVKFAEDTGVVLLMENEHACYLGTGVETARFVECINSPALKAVWDPGNAFLAGEKPFPDGYEAIKSHVAHVHVKDAELLASGKKRFVVVGEGEVDYPRQLAALKSDGYDGYISLETHYRPFAGTPEQGSRLCLQ